MPRIDFRTFALGILIPLAVTAPVLAQATRTWVSGVGDDVNPCSRTAPCKTFAGAIAKTAAGGEINALDPAGYGTLTITKSITIDGRGTMASILASATNGINVNAGATDIVVLRNLSINGAGTTIGLNGVNYLAAGNLTIENCTIENFSQNGISIAPSGSNTMTVVRNVSIDGTDVGISVSSANASGPVTATIVDSSFRAGSNTLNTFGLYTVMPSGHPGLVVAVSNSNFSDFQSAITAIGSGANLSVDNSLIKRSVTGIDTNSGAVTTGGTVASDGNNKIVGAVSNPTSTVASK
jgi:hypothetical protein